MKERIKKILGALPGVGTMTLIMAGLFLVIVLVSGTVMKLFGFRYESVWQLILYFLLVELIGVPVDLICQGLPRMLYKRGVADRRQANLFYIPLDTMCSMLIFWIGDWMMEGVTATPLSLWMITFLFALLTLPIREENSLKQ